MPSSDREHILIAVPALDYTNSTNISHMLSIAQQKNMLPGNHKFTISTVEGVQGHALVRNEISKIVLDGGFDRVWMIDDDIMPESDIFGLLDVNADIVAPLMPTLKWSATENTFDFNIAYAAGAYKDIDDLSSSCDPELDGGGAIDVDMVGTGCTLVRRAVLEDERMRYESFDLDDGECPAIFRFHRKSNGAYLSGEDEDFSVRAKRLGYSVKLHTGIEVGHMKKINIAHILKMKRYYQGCAASQPQQVADAIT